MSQKAPDSQAIPLCMEHHLEGPMAQHKLGGRFWEIQYSLDRDQLIAMYNALFEEQYVNSGSVATRFPWGL